MSNFPDLAEAAIRKGKALLYLKAEGGIGKSTSLYELWHRFLKQPQGADDKTIVPLYIPLGAVDCGILDYITVSILEWIGNREEYVKNLKALLSKKEQRHRYVLLLDGANENAEMYKMQGEIKELSEFGSVSIVLSSRTDIRMAGEWEYWTLDVLPPKIIQKYVLPEHRNEEAKKILGIPFYLEKYLKIIESDPDRLKGNQLNRFSLIQEYVDFTVEAQQNALAESKVDCRAAVYEILPGLCFRLSELRKLNISTLDKSLISEVEAEMRAYDMTLVSLCSMVMQPMGLAEQAGAKVYRLSHELYRDAFAARYLLDIFQATLPDEGAEYFLNLFACNLPEDALVLFADALLESEDGLRGSLDKINGWIGYSENAKENGRLMKNLVRLYAETGAELEGVDFSGRNLKQASFSAFSHLLNCHFDGAEFSSEPMSFPTLNSFTFPVLTPISPNEQKVLTFPEYGRIVRFHHQSIQILSAENGDIIEEWREKSIPALIEKTDSSHVIVIYMPMPMSSVDVCSLIRWDVSSCTREPEVMLRDLNEQLDCEYWLQKVSSETEQAPCQYQWWSKVPQWLRDAAEFWYDDQKILFMTENQPDTVYAIDLVAKTFRKLEGQVTRFSADGSGRECLLFEGNGDRIKILQGIRATLCDMPKKQLTALSGADPQLQKLWIAVIKMETGGHPEKPSFFDKSNCKMTVQDAVWLSQSGEHLLLCYNSENMPVLERFKMESGKICDSGIAISQLFTAASPVDFPKLCSDGERILVYTSRKIAEIFLKNQRVELLYQITSAEDAMIAVYITGDAVLVQSREGGLRCIKQGSVWWSREVAVQLSFLEWYGIPGVATLKRIFWVTLQNGTFHLEKAARGKVQGHKREQEAVIWGPIISISKLRESATQKEYLLLTKDGMGFNMYRVMKEAEHTHIKKQCKIPHEDWDYYGGLCGPYCVVGLFDGIQVRDENGKLLFYNDDFGGLHGKQIRCCLADRNIWLFAASPSLIDEDVQDVDFYRIRLNSGKIDDMGRVSVIGWNRWNLKTIHWDTAQEAFLVKRDAGCGGGILALYPPKTAGESWRTETLEASAYVWNREDSSERFLSFEKDKAHLYNDAGEEIRQILPFGHEVTGSTFEGAKGLSEEQLEILKDYGAKIE